MFRTQSSLLLLAWLFPPDSLEGANEAKVFFPPCWTAPVEVIWRNSNGEIVSYSDHIENVPPDIYTATLTNEENEVVVLEAPLTVGSADGTDQEDVCSSVTVIEEGAPEMQLFPNPMTHRAELILPDLHSFSTIAIMDLQGRSIRQESIPASQHRILIDRERLASGQYLMRLVGAEKRSELLFTVE